VSEAADHPTIDYDLTWTGSPGEGHDPLQTFAMTVLAAHKQARLAGGSATVSRLAIAETDDDARATTITARLSLHGPDPQVLRATADTIRRQAHERAGRDGTSVLVLVHGPE
jgi:N-carbamoyl-L-amino-acid hydrolase